MLKSNMWWIIPIVIMVISAIVYIWDENRSNRVIPNLNIVAITVMCWMLSIGMLIGHFL